MQQAQRLAAAVVRRVLDGTTLPSALASVAPTAGDDAGRRRSLVQELAYGTLRHWGTLDALVRRLAAKPFGDPGLPCLVAVALYQIQHTRAPAFAIVDHAVNAAAQVARPAAKSLVNALLRRYLRERAALDTAVRADPVARYSFPSWWIRRLQHEYPQDWEGILTACNERPPLSLRVNRRYGRREALLARFAANGVVAAAAGDAGIVVEVPQPVPDLPGYGEGAFSVQDLGAQLAAPLLDARDGMRVLDACAAPGGKTTHLCELADVDVVALDVDEARLGRVRENLSRLRLDGPTVQVISGDAAEPEGWWDGRPFDRVLADVPCTASGVVRRHPDVKWLRREADIAAFARTQQRMLAALWRCLAPGGRLLYTTCSVFRDENEARIEDFIEGHGDALRETINFPAAVTRHGGQLLPSPPGASHNQDGFFFALLRKD